jgi:hypothetical protein
MLLASLVGAEFIMKQSAISGVLQFAVYADTPKDAPAVDWLSLKISSFYCMTDIEKGKRPRR